MQCNQVNKISPLCLKKETVSDEVVCRSLEKQILRWEMVSEIYCKVKTVKPKGETALGRESLDCDGYLIVKRKERGRKMGHRGLCPIRNKHCPTEKSYVSQTRPHPGVSTKLSHCLEAAVEQISSIAKGWIQEHCRWTVSSNCPLCRQASKFCLRETMNSVTLTVRKNMR